MLVDSVVGNDDDANDVSVVGIDDVSVVKTDDIFSRIEDVDIVPEVVNVDISSYICTVDFVSEMGKTVAVSVVKNVEGASNRKLLKSIYQL